MPDQTTVFDDDAAGRIAEMVRRVEGMPTSTPVKPPRTAQLPPETFFALVPTGGIPARSGTTLGNATCDIYRDAPASFGSDTRVLEAVQVGGTQITRVVHNALTDAIDAGEYVPITRTKHGAWLAVPDCVCDCLIYRTGFDASAVLDDWTVTGTGSIVSGELNLSGTDATAVYDTAHPQLPYPSRVRAKVKGGTDSELRVLLSWTNAAGSGLYGFIAELQPGVGCGTVFIRQVIAGSESLLTSVGVPGAVVAQWHTVSACYDPRTGEISVAVDTADGRSTFATATATGHTDGEYAGVATGPTHGTGTAFFDDFRWDRLWYYGDGEQDDFSVYSDVVECSPCGTTACDSITADFSDEDNLCEWQTPGTWTIDATNERLESTGGALLYNKQWPNNPAWASTNTYHELYLTFKGSAVDQVIRAIICATDDANYLAAEIKIGVGSVGEVGILKIISVAAGIPTDISQEQRLIDIVPDEWYSFYVRIDAENRITAVIHSQGVAGDFTTINGMVVTDVLGTSICSGDYIGLYGDSGVKFSGFYGASCVNYGTPYCWSRDGGVGFTSYSGIDSNWTQVSGDTPTITTVATWAAAESGVLLSLHPVQPDTSDNYHVSAVFKFNPDYNGVDDFYVGTETKLGVVLASNVDGSNYFLAELTVYPAGVPLPDWNLAIYSVASGVKTLLDDQDFAPTGLGYAGYDGMTVDGVIQIGVCWAYGTIIAKTGSTTVWRGGQTANGPYHGISVEASAEYAAWAGPTSFYKTVDNETELCTPCTTTCSACIDNNQPATIIGTLAGVVGKNALCPDGECDTLNVAYYNNPSFHFVTGAKLECKWDSPPVEIMTYFNAVGNAEIYGPWDFDLEFPVCYWMDLELFSSGGYWAVRGHVIGVGRNCTAFDTGQEPPIPNHEKWTNCEDTKTCAIYGTPAAIPFPGGGSYVGSTSVSAEFIGVTGFPSDTQIDCFSDLDGLVLSFTGARSAAPAAAAPNTAPPACDFWPYDGDKATITLQVP